MWNEGGRKEREMGEGGWENRSKGTERGGGQRLEGGVEEKSAQDSLRRWNEERESGGGMEETGLKRGEPDLERKGNIRN